MRQIPGVCFIGLFLVTEGLKDSQKHLANHGLQAMQGKCCFEDTKAPHSFLPSSTLSPPSDLLTEFKVVSSWRAGPSRLETPLTLATQLLSQPNPAQFSPVHFSQPTIPCKIATHIQPDFPPLQWLMLCKSSINHILAVWERTRQPSQFTSYATRFSPIQHTPPTLLLT